MLFPQCTDSPESVFEIQGNPGEDFWVAAHHPLPVLLFPALCKGSDDPGHSWGRSSPRVLPQEEGFPLILSSFPQVPDKSQLGEPPGAEQELMGLIHPQTSYPFLLFSFPSIPPLPCPGPSFPCVILLHPSPLSPLCPRRGDAGAGDEPVLTPQCWPGTAQPRRPRESTERPRMPAEGPATPLWT